MSDGAGVVESSRGLKAWADVPARRPMDRFSAFFPQWQDGLTQSSGQPRQHAQAMASDGFCRALFRYGHRRLSRTSHAVGATAEGRDPLPRPVSTAWGRALVGERANQKTGDTVLVLGYRRRFKSRAALQIGEDEWVRRLFAHVRRLTRSWKRVRTLRLADHCDQFIANSRTGGSGLRGPHGRRA